MCIYDRAITFSNDHRRWRLAERHRLTDASRTDDVRVITDGLVALHSSDPATVYLSALARMKTPAIEAVERALYDDRSIVRHHAMRRTLWVMNPQIARLAHGAATAKIARAERQRTVAALADSTDIVDPEAWLAAAVDEIVGLLDSKGPMPTRAIGRELERSGSARSLRRLIPPPLFPPAAGLLTLGHRTSDILG